MKQTKKFLIKWHDCCCVTQRQKVKSDADYLKVYNIQDITNLQSKVLRSLGIVATFFASNIM